MSWVPNKGYQISYATDKDGERWLKLGLRHTFYPKTYALTIDSVERPLCGNQGYNKMLFFVSWEFVDIFFAVTIGGQSRPNVSGETVLQKKIN